MASRAESRARKYHSVVNTFGDSTLARRAQDWSAERIKRELGIDIYETKAIPKIRKVSKETRDKKKLSYANYQTLIQTGYEQKKALELKDKSKTYVKLKAKEITLNKIIAERTSKSNAKREFDWSRWSKKEGKFPRTILQRIAIENQLARKDIMDPYGFQIVWRVYVKGWTWEDARDFVRPLKVTGYEYKEDKRIGSS